MGTVGSAASHSANCLKSSSCFGSADSERSSCSPASEAMLNNCAGLWGQADEFLFVAQNRRLSLQSPKETPLTSLLIGFQDWQQIDTVVLANQLLSCEIRSCDRDRRELVATEAIFHQQQQGR